MSTTGREGVRVRKVRRIGTGENAYTLVQHGTVLHDSHGVEAYVRWDDLPHYKTIELWSSLDVIEGTRVEEVPSE